MKKIALFLGLLACVISIAAFANQNFDMDFVIDPKAQTSPFERFRSIETRESGFHAVFLNVEVPDEGCDLTDRAIIVATTDGGRAMFNTALMAFVNGRRAVVRVDGCISLAPGSSLTAPRAVKVQI